MTSIRIARGYRATASRLPVQRHRDERRHRRGDRAQVRPPASRVTALGRPSHAPSVARAQQVIGPVPGDVSVQHLGRLLVSMTARYGERDALRDVARHGGDVSLPTGGL
jgi:hypothetical protein